MAPSVFNEGGYIGITADYPTTKSLNLVTSGLVLHLDAGNPSSYPGTGTTWTDLSGSGYNFTVQSGSWVSVGTASYFNFSGSFCCAKRVVGGALSNVPNFTNATLMVFSSILNSTSDWRTLIRGSVNDHQVIIQDESNNLGMYDNDSNNFIGNSFDVTSIPNYTTKFNCLHWKLSQSSPFYSFGYNTIAAGTNITNGNATFNNGFCAIGGLFNNGAAVTSSADAQQYWGNVALVLYYNRTLSDAEIAQNYNAFKGRYGV